MVFSFKAPLFLVWFVVAGSALHVQNFYGEYYMDRHGGNRSYYAYLTPDTFLFEVKDYWKKSTKRNTVIFYPNDSVKRVRIDTSSYLLQTLADRNENFIVAANESNPYDTIRLYQISRYTTLGVGQWYDDVRLTTRATGEPALFRRYTMDTLADREWVLSSTRFRYDARTRLPQRNGTEKLYFSQSEQEQILEAYEDRGKHLKHSLSVKEKHRWKNGKLVKTKVYPLDSFFK